MNKFSDVYEGMLSAPDGHLDASIKPLLRALSEQDKVQSDELLNILDLCAYSALASEFVMKTLHMVWEMLVADEGKTKAQAYAEAQPRRDKMEQIREM